jgi:hypothetical protein
MIDQIPKLTAQISQGRPAGMLGCPSARNSVLRRGRSNNSPPQFGQTCCVLSEHPAQKVHSNEQM